MNHMTSFRNRQQGVVAIIVGLSIFILVGMLALVIDLGHLYITKTELQNAADAAALAGAKELDGTPDGVTAAVGKAIELAALNEYDFSKPVDITSTDISFGTSPDGPWSNGLDDPSDKFFIKVDTGNRDLDTWFARIWGVNQTRTFGMAVAGRYTIDIAPIGVCAVDKTRPEDGFIRGVAYNVPELNPLVIPADPLWINPVNAPPDACSEVDPQWNSSDSMVPFICTGKSAFLRAIPGEVFVNPGGSTALGKALNSRFGDYQGSKCDPETAPPDTNVTEYLYTAPAVNWMNPAPTQQGITIIDRKPIDMTMTIAGMARTNTIAARDYGVLWSYSRERNHGTGEDHVLDDWDDLYGIEATGYPTPSPYGKTNGRRVMNLIIIDCSVPDVNQVGPGNKCAALPTLAVGKFFMQVKANLPKKELYLEFGGLYPTPFPPADIRLYR